MTGPLFELRNVEQRAWVSKDNLLLRCVYFSMSNEANIWFGNHLLLMHRLDAGKDVAFWESSADFLRHEIENLTRLHDETYFFVPLAEAVLRERAVGFRARNPKPPAEYVAIS